MKTRIILALLLIVTLLIAVPTFTRSSPLSLDLFQSVTGTGGVKTSDDPSVPYSTEPPPPPTRDLYALTLRLRPGVTAPIVRTVNQEPPQYFEGQKQSFWLTDLVDYKHFSVKTTLRYISPHAYFYVEDGTDLSDDEIRRGADDFERIVVPSNRKYFGTEALPGIDNDPHLTIVLARFPGAAGYYSMSDEYPRAVNPYSNEREVIYIGIPGLRPGTKAFVAVLAHEYAHAIHWNEQPNQVTWMSEGIAELAAVLAGYTPVGLSSFLSAPDTQLTAWGDEPGEVHRFYGAAYLFMRYLFQHYGGPESIRDFLAEKEPGARGVDAYLKKKGFGASFDDVFKDWVVANYLDENGGGRYSHPDDNAKAAAALSTIKGPKEVAASVSQYGTDYYDLEIPTGDVTVRFDGESSVRLVATQPRSGKTVWYGNRGDSIDSTLTRAFDLSPLRTATLKFWAWYDIEDKWDYAYVEASDDGGKTWQTLIGRYTTNEDPVGNSFGAGYTGKSGERGEAEWREETMDLSAYAGKKILLRFEYVTDEGLNKPGIVIDDISIPELGFTDDAESDSGWDAEGFTRTTNYLKQRFLVQVIKTGKAGNSVESVKLDDLQDGQVIVRGFGKDIDKATLAISGLTPVTTETAPYRFSVSTTQ